MQQSMIVTTESPECGWDPFLRWLRKQGLAPADVRSIVIHDDGSAVAVMIRRTHGLPQIVDGELSTRNHRIARITGPAPVHPSREVRS